MAKKVARSKLLKEEHQCLVFGSFGTIEIFRCSFYKMLLGHSNMLSVKCKEIGVIYITGSCGEHPKSMIEMGSIRGPSSLSGHHEV